LIRKEVIMAKESQVEGKCLCGGVRFSVRLPTLVCAHCHCTMCQRAHGAGYVTWFAVAPDALGFVSGEDMLVRYASSEHGARTFCSRCGSTLFCASDLHPDRVDIVLANMEGAIDREPQLHIYFDDRADWVVVGDDLPRLGGKTGTEPTGD
jgi:hypothetical protein